MKRIVSLSVLLLLLNCMVQAQAPGIFNYQGVARNSVGNALINQNISLRLTVHDGSAAGPVVYQESRAVTTNPFGLFNVQVGSAGATNVTGTVAGVNWGVGAKYIQVEIDPNGGTTFINIGTAQMASVPYAQFSDAASNLVLPFIKSQGETGTLVRLTNTGNTGTSSAIEGVTNSTASSVFALSGTVSSASPGGFSAGVRGINNGTGGLGIGVYGSQAGSGWGVYGTAVSGIGVNGASTSGTGVNGTSTSGIGVFGSSSTGNAGRFDITNNANTSDALVANTNGAASSWAIRATSTGLQGAGIFQYNNGAGNATALRVLTNGTGYAANITSSNATPLALRTQGGLQLTGINEAVNRILTTDAAGNATWQDPAPASSLVLPFIADENNPATLFSIRNSGDGTSIEGINHTTTSNIAAVRGIVSSTSPGGFSSALRGVNNGTGGLGIGVYGSQAGSGWGVYGVTPNGLGVYGNSSGNGIGVYANSNTGTGLTATSNNGIAASLSIFNNANNNDVLNASTVGNGTVVNVTTTGNGRGVFSSTGAGFSVHGITSAVSSAGIVGDNSGGGEAVVGRTTSDIAGAVVGRNDGGGYGVRGFVATDNSGNAIGVYGQIGLNNSTGRAGRFENFNTTNTSGNTMEVETNGNGNIPDNTQGNASSFLVDNTNSVGAGVRSEVKTIFGNFGAAAVFGNSSGTGGLAGLFYASNPAGNGASLVALTDGNGNAITANAGKDGNGVETNIDGNGNALYAWVPSFATGRAGRFNIFNEDNTSDAVTIRTVGNGTAMDAMVDRVTGTSPAVRGEVNSQFANFGTAGIYGVSSGTGGYAGLFHASNPVGNGPAVVVIADGNGNAITANASNGGDGIEATVDGTGTAVFGWTPNFSNGRAGRFVNFNTGNTNSVLTVEQHSNGTIALFKSGNPGTTNVARISATGEIFANGGFTVGGADMAEYFEAEGERSSYEPGDVLVISERSDRKIEKSSTPYSYLVSGVYATKPGMKLTEENAVDGNLDHLVPMGVVGVIPTKVCLEGGVIKRGDVLVTSSIPGVAMKGDRSKVQIGQVLGKALQGYDGTGIGKINVLVNVK